MPESLGSVTKTIIEHIEAHKLNLEFEANGDIVAGDLVALEAAGTVVAGTNSADEHSVIGIALMDAADGDMVTVSMRGFALVVGESEAGGVDCGPVELGSFNATTGLREYLASSAVAKTVGWNIVQTLADGDELKVVLKA
jgi:hypothetical protein